MNKAQAVYAFWSGFGLDAFDESSVPDDTPLPYITFASATDSLGNVVNLSGSLWYRSTSWAEIEAKTEEIARALGENGYYRLKLDGGYVWFVKGTPFAQRMGDPDDPGIRRMYINVQAEFLTAY